VCRDVGYHFFSKMERDRSSDALPRDEYSDTFETVLLVRKSLDPHALIYRG
jgi:hypothetical protein